MFCRLLVRKLQKCNARNWTNIALLKKVQCSRQIDPPLQVNCNRDAESITNPSNPQKFYATFARLLQRFPFTLHWKRWNVDALKKDGNWTIEISIRHREYIFRHWYVWIKKITTNLVFVVRKQCRERNYNKMKKVMVENEHGIIVVCPKRCCSS